MTRLYTHKAKENILNNNFIHTIQNKKYLKVR